MNKLKALTTIETPKARSPYAALIRTPDMLPGYAVVPFKDLDVAVAAHLLANQIEGDETWQPPRVLAVQGAPGTGKSTCVVSALKRGTAVGVISPALCSGESEGQAVANLKEALGAFVDYSAENRQHIAALFDDVDTSIINVGKNTGHTTASLNLIGELQQICDNPRLYTCFDGTPIPFIATMNAGDEGIRASLFRDVRADRYTHEPSEDEKLTIVHGLFKPATKDERALIDKLFRANSKEPIAFWAAIRTDIKSARLKEVLARGAVDVATARAVIREPAPLDPALMWDLVKRRRASRLRNFLSH